MAELPKKLKEFMETLSNIEDRQERMNLLIEYADTFEEVTKDIAQKPFPDDTKVPFCESEAYVFSRLINENKIEYFFAVENPQGISAKALCAIFTETLDGETPEAILKIPTDIVLDIFGKELSMGKNMGLTGILQMMQRQAKNQITKNKYQIT